jgi:hypothetical protein
MKLIEYMRANALDDETMADRVGSITSHGIRKLKYGERKPSLAIAVRIEEVTGGAVTASEWIRNDQPSAEAA